MNALHTQKAVASPDGANGLNPARRTIQASSNAVVCIGRSHNPNFFESSMDAFVPLRFPLPLGPKRDTSNKDCYCEDRMRQEA
jgi:hypothetical protein